MRRDQRSLNRVVLLCACVASIACAPHHGEIAQARLAVVVDTMVTANGTRLHFVLSRGRGPVVVFEAGGGADASEWSALQSRVATQTGFSSVSYDRAGFGRSELPARPYNVLAELADLRAGLLALGLKNHLILVGHSY